MISFSFSFFLVFPLQSHLVKSSAMTYQIEETEKIPSQHNTTANHTRINARSGEAISLDNLPVDWMFDGRIFEEGTLRRRVWDG